MYRDYKTNIENFEFSDSYTQKEEIIRLKSEIAHLQAENNRLLEITEQLGLDSGDLHQFVETEERLILELAAAKSELGAEREKHSKVCKWTLYSGKTDVWETECGYIWDYFELDPKRKEFEFCPYCGCKIEQFLPQPPEDDK
jgi:hypothetical protein